MLKIDKVALCIYCGTPWRKELLSELIIKQTLAMFGMSLTVIIFTTELNYQIGTNCPARYQLRYLSKN